MVGVGVVEWGRADGEFFSCFRADTNDYDDHDRTRIQRMKLINTDLRRVCENARIRCPDCRTERGPYPFESVGIR